VLGDDHPLAEMLSLDGDPLLLAARAGFPMADFECRHGRLPSDRTPDCGCFNHGQGEPDMVEDLNKRLREALESTIDPLDEAIAAAAAELERLRELRSAIERGRTGEVSERVPLLMIPPAEIPLGDEQLPPAANNDTKPCKVCGADSPRRGRWAGLCVKHRGP
jgi:hypothetical protein